MPRSRSKSATRAVHYDNPTFVALLARLRRNLRALRRAKKWTMVEAAERCDLLYQNYQAIEAGRINVTAVTIARLADGFHVDVSELVAAVKKT